jgi:hypothetical protein
MVNKTILAAIRSTIPSFAVMAFAAAAMPGVASAAAVFGSAAQLTSRDCSSVAANLDCAYRTTIAQRNVNQFLGGVGVELDNTTTNANGTWVVGTGANPGGLPILRAGTWSGLNSRLNTNAVVFQQFTFTGPAHTLFSIVGDLTYDFSGNDGLSDNGLYDNTARTAEQAGEGGIFANMYFMDPAAFNGISTAREVMALLQQDCSNSSMYAYAAFGSGDTPGAKAPGHHTEQLTINKDCSGSDIYLNPGDSAILVLSLQTASNRGGYSDSTHTFISNFDPRLPQETLNVLRSNFVPASPADIPEPATLALTALALLGLGATRVLQR